MNQTLSTQNRHSIPPNVVTLGSLNGEQHRQAATTASMTDKTRLVSSLQDVCLDFVVKIKYTVDPLYRLMLHFQFYVLIN